MANGLVFPAQVNEWDNIHIYLLYCLNYKYPINNFRVMMNPAS